MSDVKFINGLIVKAPNDNAPEYVICKLSIKRQELIAWLQQQDGEWINAEVKESQGGKWYAAVDEWKPNQGGGTSSRRGGQEQRERPQRATDNAPQNEFADDDIPFISMQGDW
ncbi:hypothetical protein [Stenotrophomonas geniculata]|uniref:hypothetical protein n=1 Tax=Stenotrophomonas geniculata TaxID=86188 RepID=UPI002E781ECB|nr:hypothetical protein [Stenotrophomonas geniculata]